MTRDPQLRADRLQAVSREVLGHLVYKAVYETVETFSENNVGADLAYLLGAILNIENHTDSYVDWITENGAPYNLTLQVLKDKFPREHVLWEFVMLDEDVLA